MDDRHDILSIESITHPFNLDLTVDPKKGEWWLTVYSQVHEPNDPMVQMDFDVLSFNELKVLRDKMSEAIEAHEMQLVDQPNNTEEG